MKLCLYISFSKLMSSFLSIEENTTGKFHTPTSLFARKAVMKLFPKQMLFSSGLSHSPCPSCLLFFHLVMSTCFMNLTQIPSKQNQTFLKLSTWGKIGNPLTNMKSVALLEETIVTFKITLLEESSNGFPMFLTANPESLFQYRKERLCLLRKGKVFRVADSKIIS